MSINKSWNSIIILLTLLLSVGFNPAVSPAQQPQPGTSDEERQQIIDRLRERILNNQQGQGQGRGQGRGFPGGMMQQVFQPPAATPAQTQTPAAQTAAVPQQINLQQSNGQIQLNIKDMDLNGFIEQISQILGLTPLLIDPEVQGTVTIYTATPMTKEEVYDLFNLILKTKNASLIYQDNVYQVVPISSALKTGVELIVRQPPAAEPEAAPAAVPETPRQAPQEPAPDTSQAQPPAAPAPLPAGAIPAAESSRSPKLSTNVVPVEFIPVKDLIEPIKLFMSDGGVIMPYERLNMLILTDYEDSIDRILKVIHVLDNKFMDKDLMDLIEIRHNSSSDVAADLKKIFGDGTENGTTGISFVSLDRLNAIFVMAGSNRALSEVKRWIDVLDTTTGRSVQTNVYIVENSTASNIATLLYNLYGGQVSTPQQTTRNNAGAAGFPGTQQQQGGSSNLQRGSFGSFVNTDTLSGSGNNQSSMFGGLTSSGLSTSGQQLNPQFNTSRTISSMVIEAGEFSGLQDTVRIVVDDISNRLIIQSTATDYQFMLEAIKLMDIMPRQVVIDARVFEVDLTDDLSFGVGAALRERTGGSVTEVGLNTTSADGTTTTGALTAYNIALVGSSQELLSAINALREKTNVRVLEAPSVLAMDGTQAHITVGAEIPYTGSLYYQTNAENPTQSVNYRDTGVTLYVLPRISASGSVSLEVLQEVSGVGANTSLGPTFTKSRVDCTLTVKDGETVAIAGLIRDNKSLVRSGFPLISDIPILGSLFGQTARNNKRSELIILITPHVIKDADEFKEFTQKFKDSMKNVRRFSDESDRQRLENIQDAIEERKKAEEERLKQEENEQRRIERAKERTRD